MLRTSPQATKQQKLNGCAKPKTNHIKGKYNKTQS